MAQDGQTKGPGRGWHKDPEGHARAGKLGGEKVLEERGNEFYAEIGQQGGSVSPGNFKNDPERASEAGKKGGQNSHGSANQTSIESREQDQFYEELNRSLE